MNIIVTGRRITVADGIREYAEKKFEKLGGYFNQVVGIHVILHLEKLDRGVEIIISGDGVQFHGSEKGETFFAAIDLLVEKMDKQIVRYKNKSNAHKGAKNDFLFFVEADSDEAEYEIKLNEVSNKPQDRVEAYLQMKNNKMDFTLFKQSGGETENVDFANKKYAVIFKSGNDFRMTEIPFEMIKQQNFDEGNFLEYRLDVKDDSFAHPDIDFIKIDDTSLSTMTIMEAVEELNKNGNSFLPFFNLDSMYFNIIYKTGRDYTVMIPAS